MRCPACDTHTKTIQTRRRYKHGRRTGPARWRSVSDPSVLDVRRRRECPACGFRFTTYESVDMTQAEVEAAREAHHHGAT